jgi:hypothetical protein
MNYIIFFFIFLNSKIHINSRIVLEQIFLLKNIVIKVLAFKVLDIKNFCQI